MSEPTFPQRIRNIAEWLDSKVEIGSSSFDLAPGPVSQFDFELSEAAHGLTMIAADLDRALAAPTAQAPTEPVARGVDGALHWEVDSDTLPRDVPLYATPPSAAQTDAVGWKLVPIEPTRDMRLAGGPDCASVWDNMLAAAPTTEATSSSDAERLTDEQILALWSGSDDRALRPVLGSKKIIAFARAILATKGGKP